MLFLRRGTTLSIVITTITMTLYDRSYKTIDNEVYIYFL